MRTLDLASPTTLQPELTQLQALGPLGARFAAWLTGEMIAQRLTQASATTYVDVLRRFAMAMARETPARALQAPGLARGVAAVAADAPARAPLLRAVLERFFASEGRSLPRAPELDDALAAAATARARARETRRTAAAAAQHTAAPMAVSDELTLDTLRIVQREAQYLVRQARQLGTREPTALLRATLVAMCRWAGASPADLVACTLDDLAADGRWTGTLGAEWRVLRINRRARGRDKGQVVALPLPEIVHALLRSWIEYREMVAHAALDGQTPLFVDVVRVDADGAPLVLDRKRVWAIVSGTAVGYRPLALAQPRTRPVADVAKSSLEQPWDDAIPDDALVILNPRLLRHCLLFELVERAPYLRDAEALMRAHVGSQGNLAPYRRLLFQEAAHVTGGAPARRLPRRARQRAIATR